MGIGARLSCSCRHCVHGMRPIPQIFAMAGARIRVQAKGGAVGWVRNASPICEDPAFYVAGFVLGVVRSIAELLERPTRILPLRPLISWLIPN